VLKKRLWESRSTPTLVMLHVSYFFKNYQTHFGLTVHLSIINLCTATQYNNEMIGKCENCLEASFASQEEAAAAAAAATFDTFFERKQWQF
jgi:hypothetical protein